MNRQWDNFVYLEALVAIFDESSWDTEWLTTPLVEGSATSCRI
ncbi:hypothetical protein [Mycobacterium sp.]|nr:hypothetical protein [Mycobacterium sp.]HKP41354.1 hypothetical protein [Mycobacterium sp.]